MKTTVCFMRNWHSKKSGKQRKMVMRVLIITGGTVDLQFTVEYLKQEKFDRVIAADAGLIHCKEAGILPTDILGDFDSLNHPDLLEEYRDAGVPVRSFPTRKDYTDTHLAVMYAKDLNPEEVVLLGATGTRLDHMLANIGMLEYMAGEGVPCKIVDAHNEVELLCGNVRKKYRRPEEKTFFSLVAWNDKVTGIDLEGFSYPLKNGTLDTAISLGISNEIVEEYGTLQMRTGKLLVIQSRD